MKRRNDNHSPGVHSFSRYCIRSCLTMWVWHIRYLKSKISYEHKSLTDIDQNIYLQASDEGLDEKRRKKSLEQFLTDNKLSTQPTGKTYTAPNGAEVSTIDYIFYDQNLVDNVLKIETLTDEHTSVSDHYLLCCTLECVVNRHVTFKPEVAIAPPKESQMGQARQGRI